MGMWLVVTDLAGNLIWQNTYTNGNFQRNYATECYSIIQNDDNGFLLGGYSNIPNVYYSFTVMRADAEGEQIWWRTYGDRWGE